jgi:hypothetical protein
MRAGRSTLRSEMRLRDFAELSAILRALHPKTGRQPGSADLARRSQLVVSIRRRITMAKERKDDGNAFIRDPGDGPIRSEGIGSEMVEEFMLAATSGEDMSEDIRNQVTDEEYGGPFVTTRMSDEMADDEDESNPSDATQEPLPSPMRGRS